MRAVPEERELQDRVRLFVQVMLTVDVLAHVSDFLNPLLFGLEPPPMTGLPLALRWGATALGACTWMALRTWSLSQWVLVTLELIFTLGLTWTYVVIALAYVEIRVLGPVFALLGIILLLVVRASLVPSTVSRTASVGTLALLILFAGAWDVLATLDPMVTDGVAFMGASIVIASCVSSRVIYGLREQVRGMRRLGQYTLEEKIGEGGMGRVFRASHGMLRRPTAIKLLPPDRAGEDHLRRFEREVRLTAQLTHPNTVTVFDYGRTPEGVFYYAMELLDGVTLEEAVALTGPQSETRTVHILDRCARALGEAHAIGLIHRDVKPSNIMLCRQGTRRDVVKVLDFGLVKRIEGREDVVPEMTATNAWVGTPHYMSPEAIRDPERVDGRSDLYALGAVGYFLLAGTHVFDGDTVVEICAQHLHQVPEPPTARRGSSVAPRLEALLLQCLEKDPDRRPASARVISDVLAQIAPSDRFSAGEWWEEHAISINALREEARRSLSGATLAVDPR